MNAKRIYFVSTRGKRAGLAITSVTSPCPAFRIGNSKWAASGMSLASKIWEDYITSQLRQTGNGAQRKRAWAPPWFNINNLVPSLHPALLEDIC